VDSVKRYFAAVKITNPAHRAYWIASRRIRKTAEQYFGGRMLEIGCGSKTKGPLVGDYVTEHVGLDYPDTPHDKANKDRFGTAYNTLVESDPFDCVPSTAVLEHREKSKLALKEAFRVLKPGSCTINTAPLFWQVPEKPRDLIGSNGCGLDYLSRKVGFQLAELTAPSGFGVTLFAQLIYFLRNFRKGPLIPLVDASIIFNNPIVLLVDLGGMRDEHIV